MSDPAFATYVALGSNGSESITDNAEILLKACQLIEKYLRAFYQKKRIFIKHLPFRRGMGPILQTL